MSKTVIQTRYSGRVWKFGDNIDTDLIIPARFLNRSEPDYLGQNCFADVFPSFSKTIAKGDIIVAGANFGCGSSREHAPIAIKAAGISCVIASSFARIFYRNAFNTGLIILESPGVEKSFEQTEEAEVDITKGVILNKTKGLPLKAEPIPEFMRRLVSCGGLINYVKETYGQS